MPVNATGAPSAGKPNIPLLRPRVIQRDTIRSPAAFVKTSKCSLVAPLMVFCISATQALKAARPAITLPAVVIR